MVSQVVEDNVRVAYQEVAALLASAEQTRRRLLDSSDLILIAEGEAAVEAVVERHPRNLPLWEGATSGLEEAEAAAVVVEADRSRSQASLTEYQVMEGAVQTSLHPLEYPRLKGSLATATPDLGEKAR